MNTSNSSIKGKAYEYACIVALETAISAFRKVEIIKNESFKIAKSRYEKCISDKEKSEMLASAKSGIKAIIEMEPKITEDNKDKVVISIQPDNVATKLGDIRDILIIRREPVWEIGISVKHNHAALKHSRLSAKLDFGKIWIDSPCSKKYFSEIKPVFERLTELKSKKVKWNSLAEKETSIYMPLLDAFRSELQRINIDNKDTTKNIIKYLIGSNGKDYYKLIHNNNHTTTIIPFNLFNTLNSSTNNVHPSIIIPTIELPTRIIDFSYKPNSKTTLILTLDNGWSVSFRIHNASSIVEPSLKFDIQLQSQPANMFYLNLEW